MTWALFVDFASLRQSISMYTSLERANVRASKGKGANFPVILEFSSLYCCREQVSRPSTSFIVYSIFLPLNYVIHTQGASQDKRKQRTWQYTNWQKEDLSNVLIHGQNILHFSLCTLPFVLEAHCFGRERVSCYVSDILYVTICSSAIGDIRFTRMYRECSFPSNRYTVTK